MKMKNKYQYIILSTATNRVFKKLYQKYKEHWLLDEVGFYNIRNWIYKDIKDQAIMPVSLDTPKERVGQYLHSTGNQLGDSLTYSLEKNFCSYISSEIYEKEDDIDLLEKLNNRRLKEIKERNWRGQRKCNSRVVLEFIDSILEAERKKFSRLGHWKKHGVIVSTYPLAREDPELFCEPPEPDCIYIVTESDEISCYISDVFQRISSQMGTFINYYNNRAFFMQLACDANTAISMGRCNKRILIEIHNSAMRNFQELLVNTTLYLIQEIQWNIDIDRKKIATEKQKNNNFGFKK